MADVRRLRFFWWFAEWEWELFKSVRYEPKTRKQHWASWHSLGKSRKSWKINEFKLKIKQAYKQMAQQHHREWLAKTTENHSKFRFIIRHCNSDQVCVIRNLGTGNVIRLLMSSGIYHIMEHGVCLLPRKLAWEYGIVWMYLKIISAHCSLYCYCVIHLHVKYITFHLVISHSLLVSYDFYSFLCS